MPHEFIFAFTRVSLGWHCQENVIKSEGFGIEGLSIEGGRSNILHAMIYSRKYLPALSQSKAAVLVQVRAIVRMLLFN